jgi:hypothetical protein
MHTLARALGFSVFIAALGGPAVAQVSISLGNSGFESAVSAGLPTTAGSWGGDLNSAVTSQNGVTPRTGSQMLSFLTMSPDGTTAGTGSDTVQLVDLSAYASSISVGNFNVTLSAYFNRSDTTYNNFQTIIRSYSGSLANFPTDLNTSTATQVGDLFADANVATWELGSVSLTLPTNTTYIAIWISAVALTNPSSLPVGYYADDVTLTAIPEPSTYAMIAGVAALGLAAWRRRQRVSV